jgi:small subunit ribosomal protein S4
MARYTDPSCRQCRRIGEKLFLKGERCYTPRCAVERRKKPPGDRSMRRRRATDWSLQLREKQKARFTYGVLERQFRNYFEMARERTGVTGEILLQLLERRLDNVVFRLSFAESRKQGRQFVNHGHFTVNGRRMDIPSYLVEPGDVVQWKASNDSLPDFAKTIMDSGSKRTVPGWLRPDQRAGSAEVLGEPTVEHLDSDIDVRLIVEFYSK